MVVMFFIHEFCFSQGEFHKWEVMFISWEWMKSTI